VWYFTRRCSCICIDRIVRRSGGGGGVVSGSWWWKAIPQISARNGYLEIRSQVTTIGKVVLLAGCCGCITISASASVLRLRFVQSALPLRRHKQPLLPLSCLVRSCAVLCCPIRCLSPCLAKLPASHPPAKSPTERAPQTDTDITKILRRPKSTTSPHYAQLKASQVFFF
jgi:hypothetical protein